MNDAVPVAPPAVDSTFDITRPLFAEGPPDPVVYDGSARAMRQRTVNFAAKRFADMHVCLRPRPQHRGAPFSLAGTGASRRPGRAARSGCRQCGVERRTSRRAPDDRDQRCGPPRHRAVERSGVRRTDHRLGDRTSGLRRHPARLTCDSRLRSGADRAPQPDTDRCLAARRCRRAAAPPPVELAAALDVLFANSTGIYGILIASPDRVLAERYSAFGRPDRATPSWSMTKADHLHADRPADPGRLAGSVYDPAPAPLWRDPRSIHHLITLDHLLRMRSGLGFPGG